MNTIETEYCRLCAEKKPLNKLANLQNNAERWQNIVDKLTRFNIFVDLHENILPRTVCFLCSKSLESAFAFVTTVEHAQATLSDFVVVQVKEENDSAAVNIFNDLTDESIDSIDETAEESDIKSEHSDNNKEIDISDTSMDSIDEIADESGIKSDHSDNNMKIKRLNNDSDVQFYKPQNEDKSCIDIKEKEVTEKLDIEIEIEHETFTETLQKNNKDKISNAELNIDLNKFQKVDTGNTLKSTPKAINGNIEYSMDYIAEQINRLAKIPLNAIKKTWTDFSWKCSHCETIFPNVEELQAHSMLIHNACNSYQCSDCNARKLNLNGYIKHVREHRKYLHYSCYKCFMKFSTPQKGQKHKREHNTSNYICLGCNTPFTSKDELETHVQAFFKDLWGKKYVENSIGSSKDLISHTRKREHFCEICGKGFYEKVYLTNHMMVHSDTKPYECEICKYKFKNLKLLRYHSKTHSGEKPFKCDQCDRCYREKHYLTKHKLIHSDSSYNCTQCDKKFRTKDYLKNHMRQHTGEKPYSCEICERRFTGWSNYNKHMKRKHGMDKSKTKRTPLGPHAVDPTTGDVIYPDMDKVLEWKKKMKEPLPRRPKVKVDKISLKKSLNNLIMKQYYSNGVQ